MILCLQSAEFQAESLMNGLFATSKCDFIMLNDLDYLVQNGDNCIAMKIFSGASVTMDNAVNGLDADLENKPNFHPASARCLFFPIFECLSDRQLRVLLAIVTVSDAWPSGVPDVGIAKCQKL